MTENAWKYLEKMWDDEAYPSAVAGEVISNLWPDVRDAAQELTEAGLEVIIAERDKPTRDALVAASEHYSVGGLPYCLQAMLSVLCQGLLAIGTPAMEVLQRWFKESEDISQKTGVAVLLGPFGEAAADSVLLLVAEVANSTQPKARRGLRCAAAYALGKIKVASAEVVETLSQVAGATGDDQPVRSYCIEALLDLGPPAVAAIPVLNHMLRNEAEDDDLRHFAWSALKSVFAGSYEHPCGSTMAEHIRSLNRAEPVWELNEPESSA